MKGIQLSYPATVQS